jgi:hypothetical protein
MRNINGILGYEREDIADLGMVLLNDAATVSNALVAIPGLSIPLMAYSTYEFEAVLSCNTGNDANGCEYGVNFSGAGAFIEAIILGAVTVATSRTNRIVAFNTATPAFLTTALQDGGVLIKGIIRTVANGGNLTIQHLKVTGNTSTVRIGSLLKTRKLE